MLHMFVNSPNSFLNFWKIRVRLIFWDKLFIFFVSNVKNKFLNKAVQVRDKTISTFIWSYHRLIYKYSPLQEESPGGIFFLSIGENFSEGVEWFGENISCVL